MKHRAVRKIIPAEKINMGGHILDQALPNQHMEQLDPFLLIHHAKWEFPGQQRPQEVGIGGHPHRGFSPVTFVFQGDVRHQDSFGNDAIVKAGGTQWMHAGKGIIHSERPSKELAMSGGTQEIIQFWVNTPAHYKMEVPFYFPLSAEDTPTIKDDKYTIQVVAGEFRNLVGPAKTFSPQLLLKGIVNKSHTLEMEIPNDYNCLVYTLNGKLTIKDSDVPAKSLIWFDAEGEGIQFTAEEDTQFIVLSGEPIGESVTSYGPFVMNSQTEILEALRDSQMGKMGVLIENFE